MIYLDNAATTLIKPASVSGAVREAMLGCASPGRGAYPAAMRASELLFRCRCAAAELFNVPSPEQVVFTMNATHALNLAIHTLATHGTRVLISGFEHNAVLRPLIALGAELRTAGTMLFDPEDTLIAFERDLPWAELVVCTQVSNVFGYILPIREIAERCAERKIPLIIDASQAAGVLSVDLKGTQAAFIAMPGHKGLYGPQGTGLLLCGRAPEPLLFGGSGSDSLSRKMPEYLPERAEAGTHNVCGVAGLLAGLSYVMEASPDRIFSHERTLLTRALSELSDSNYHVFSDAAHFQCGVLSLLHPKLDVEELAARLAEKEICVRSGLHCAPLAHQSAGTLESGTLRLSFSAFTTEEEVIRACSILKTIS